MEDIFTDTKPCRTCGTPTVIVDIFPLGLCLKCYAEKMDRAPLVKPDFTATIRREAK